MSLEQKWFRVHQMQTGKKIKRLNKKGWRVITVVGVPNSYALGILAEREVDQSP